MKIKMKMLLWLSLLWAGQSALAQSDEIHADGGHLQLHSFYELLSSQGIEVVDSLQKRDANWERNGMMMPITAAGGLTLSAPYGGLKAVKDGQFNLQGGFQWHLADGQVVNFSGLSLRQSSRPLKSSELTALELVNDQGQVLLLFDHIHAGFNETATQLNLLNMDVRISPWLAKHINRPDLLNWVVGHAHLQSNLTIPAGYKAQEFPLGSCSAGDNWPPGNPDVDVALISMSAQYVRDVGPDHVVFTPSATLENVGTADVAWWRKFTGNNPPYSNDQHPYLVWNLYREVDNRFEQIGVSGVKHAFFTVNTVCPCAGGQILYPTCQDTYSVGNNDSGSHLGPRQPVGVHQGIDAFSGEWNSTGSFFDQDSNGVQETSSNGTNENRMIVAEADISDDQLDYYMSSWYLIRDDVNIFNNMGHIQYALSPNGGGWSMLAQSAFTQGPASDNYVAPNTFDLPGGQASTRVLRDGEGHLTVAVKVIDLGGGLYRYNYMIENHDYDPRVKAVTVPLSDLNAMSDFAFADPDENAGNDWSQIHQNDGLTLTGPSFNELDWGVLYSFSFTTDAPPAAGTITLIGSENGNDAFEVDSMVPFFDDLIFADDFETL